MIRAVVLVGIAAGGAGCAAPKAPGAFPKVSYYAQDSAFASAEPLRVSVGTGEQRRSLRGIELAPYHPFLVSGEMPLDTGATLPISVVMLGASAPSRCGIQVAAPVQRTGGAHPSDSLFVSISAVRDGEKC